MDAVIVGARRQRQGTGPFIANMLKQEGHDVVGVVGSCSETAQSAVQQLHDDYHIDTNAYKNLDDALNAQAMDIVVIATPYNTHLQFLEQTAHTPCHVFCEKPLFWNADSKKTDPVKLAEELATEFSRHKKVLHLNTQWIYTLPYLLQLYPQMSLLPEDVLSVEMGLSPMSAGDEMLIDSMPHFISILQACLGEITLSNLTTHRSNDQKQLTLDGVCLHSKGETVIRLETTHCPTMPRPAWYAINQNRVNRRIRMPEYSLALENAEELLPISDPMLLSIRDFLTKIRSSQTDNALLVNGMYCLQEAVNSLNPQE